MPPASCLHTRSPPSRCPTPQCCWPAHPPRTRDQGPKRPRHCKTLRPGALAHPLLLLRLCRRRRCVCSSRRRLLGRPPGRRHCNRTDNRCWAPDTGPRGRPNGRWVRASRAHAQPSLFVSLTLSSVVSVAPFFTAVALSALSRFAPHRGTEGAASADGGCDLPPLVGSPRSPLPPAVAAGGLTAPAAQSSVTGAVKATGGGGSSSSSSAQVPHGDALHVVERQAAAARHWHGSLGAAPGRDDDSDVASDSSGSGGKLSRLGRGATAAGAGGGQGGRSVALPPLVGMSSSLSLYRGHETAGVSVTGGGVLRPRRISSGAASLSGTPSGGAGGAHYHPDSRCGSLAAGTAGSRGQAGAPPHLHDDDDVPSTPTHRLAQPPPPPGCDAALGGLSPVTPAAALGWDITPGGGRHPPCRLPLRDISGPRALRLADDWDTVADDDTWRPGASTPGGSKLRHARVCGSSLMPTCAVVRGSPGGGTLARMERHAQEYVAGWLNAVMHAVVASSPQTQALQPSPRRASGEE